MIHPRRIGTIAIPVLVVGASIVGIWISSRDAAPGRAPGASAPARGAASPGGGSATTERELIVPINSPPWDVPEEVRRAGLHGEIRAEVVLNEDGTVREVNLDTAGHPLVNAAFIAAKKKTRYRMPAWTKGKARLVVVSGCSY